MAENGAHLTNDRVARRVAQDNEVNEQNGNAEGVTINGFFGLGPAETATVASGVLTVTKSHVNVLPESATSDTVDSIVKANVQGGDILLLTSKATNTITFDDANINLAAATRAVAPGGSILLYHDGTEWTELMFLAASDNA